MKYEPTKGPEGPSQGTQGQRPVGQPMQRPMQVNGQQNPNAQRPVAEGTQNPMGQRPTNMQ